MNREETTAIMAIIKTAYPSFYKDNVGIDDAISLWSTLFESEPVHIVKEAVKAHMCTQKFPPSVSEIKEKIALLIQSEVKTEMEAWGIVLEGIKNATYSAQENFDGFPPVIKKIVGSPKQLRQWARMEADVVNSVIQSNFMRSYAAKLKAEKEYALLPESAKMLSESIGKKLLNSG